MLIALSRARVLCHGHGWKRERERREETEGKEARAEEEVSSLLGSKYGIGILGGYLVSAVCLGLVPLLLRARMCCLSVLLATRETAALGLPG